jgi:ferritin-like protein
VSVAGSLCTRRALLGTGAAAIALALDPRGAPPAGAAGLDDSSILTLNLRVEQVVALAYELALAGGRLDRHTQGTLTAIAGQERQHADALAAFLRELGGPLPAPPRGIAAVDAVVPGLGRARTQSDVLAVLADLERVSVHAYYLGIQQLYDQKLVQTATAVLGDESQHLVVLRHALGRDPVPFALELGAPDRAPGVR